LSVAQNKHDEKNITPIASKKLMKPPG